MTDYQALLQSPILTPPVARLVRKSAVNSAPVLIQGEQGTGKELVAKIIHHTGDWKSYPFFRIDCRILGEQALLTHLCPLLEEIRFGITPATFFLNEVGDLGPADQLKLLDLVEDGLWLKGVEKKVVKNIRFISSSSEDLKERVAHGDFSEDLYFRLKTLSIVLPPLRDRARDIGPMAEYLLKESAKQLKIKNAAVSHDVLRLLESYWWPGNLKELEHVLVRSAVLSEGETITGKDLLMDAGMEGNSFCSFLKKTETRTAEPPKDNSNGLSIPDTTLFFVELVHRIKNPLVSIKTFTQLLGDKFNDEEFRSYFYRIVTEDIEKIDDVLNGLLNYIKINYPIEKKNTIHDVIEEVLKKHGAQIEDKKIKIFKKYEKDLPETTVHDEQLRYILTSLVRYAIPSIPPDGSIGFLTKSLDDAKWNQEERSVEIWMVFTGYKKPFDSLDALFEMPAVQKKELTDLEIRLIQEMIERNRGRMTFEVHEKKLRTLISVRFPVERRKVITYQST
jgi:hypothetical protein